MKDYEFQPHGPQTTEPPLSTSEKLLALAAAVAYVAALILADLIDRGFQP